MDNILEIEVYGYWIIALSLSPALVDFIRYRRIIFDNPIHIPFALLALFMGFRLVFLSSPESWGLFQNLTGEVDPLATFQKIAYYVICSMIAMLCGYQFFAHPKANSPGISLKWSKEHGEGMARLGPFGLILFTVIFLSLGQWSTQKLQMNGYGNTSAYVYMLIFTKSGILTLITVYIVGRIPYKFRSSIFNPTYFILLIAFAIYLYTSFSTQGRFQLVAPLVAFGILLLRFNPTSKKLQSVLILSFLFGLFLFNLAGALRVAYDEENKGNELNFSNIYRYYTERLSASEDFNGVEGMAMNMKYFNDEEGYLWGKSYAAVLWHWWPRSFVEQYLGIKKPLTVGIHLKGIFLADSNRLSENINRESGTLGFSPTFLGQNYENFGFVGGVICAFIQGVGLALLYNWVTRRYFSINVQTLYACFLAAMPGLARGGTVAIDGANAFMGYLPVLLVIIIYRAPGAKWFPQGDRSKITSLENPDAGFAPSFPPFAPANEDQEVPQPTGPVSHVRNISYPKRTMNPPTPNKATQE